MLFRSVIDVTFRYNINGILEVNAKCISNGQEMTVTVQDALKRSSQQEFEDSMAKIESIYNETREDIDLEDIDLDEELSWEDLKEEANEQIKDLKDLKINMNEKQLKQADKLILRLEKAMADQDSDTLILTLEDTIVFFIDFELLE